MCRGPQRHLLYPLRPLMATPCESTDCNLSPETSIFLQRDNSSHSSEDRQNCANSALSISRPVKFRPRFSNLSSTPSSLTVKLQCLTQKVRPPQESGQIVAVISGNRQRAFTVWTAFLGVFRSSMSYLVDSPYPLIVVPLGSRGDKIFTEHFSGYLAANGAEIFGRATFESSCVRLVERLQSILFASIHKSKAMLFRLQLTQCYTA